MGNVVILNEYMSTDQKQDKQASSASSKQTVILLISTLADTTWRLFVPTVLGCILGVWADNSIDSKPWFSIIGTMAGILLSVLLVRAQIKRIDKVNE